MASSYLLDKESSLGRMKELQKHVDAAKKCFSFTFRSLLFNDEKCEKRNDLGYGRLCLRYLEVLLWMERVFISNYKLRNFNSQLSFGLHGFPSLGSWQADIEFIKENRRGKYNCDYWDCVDEEKLSAIKIKEEEDYLCFLPNNLSVRFSYSKERFVMSNNLNFCLIALPKEKLQLDHRSFFERNDAPKKFYSYKDPGLNSDKILDYWQMICPSGRSRLWMRMRDEDSELVWFFMHGRLTYSKILSLSPEELEDFHYLVIKVEERKEGETVDDICRHIPSEKIKYLINEIAF